MTCIRWLDGLVVVGLVAAVGCTSDNDASRKEAADNAGVEVQSSGAKILIAAETISVEEAAVVIGEERAASLAITGALCNGSDRCKDVGIDGAYESREQCFRETGEDWNGRFSQHRCENGIDMARLDTCLDLIRNDECRNPLDTLARLAACQPSVFCRKP